jgi:hypothetical protein
LLHFGETLKVFIRILLIESVKWFAYLLHELVVVELNALLEMGLVPSQKAFVKSHMDLSFISAICSQPIRTDDEQQKADLNRPSSVSVHLPTGPTLISMI